MIAKGKAIKTKTGKIKSAASKKKITGSSEINAKNFIERMNSLQSDAEREKIQRYFKSGKGEYSEGVTFMGVRMGHIFALAKKFIEMQPDQIEKLLHHRIHEIRVGAVSIMDFQARNKKTSEARRKELFDLYINYHDKINNWDLVDRSAPYVVGGYLFDKPRTILYKLARSKNMWQRRTAIVSTYYFIRQGDTDDTFKIAEILIKDKEDLIHKAVGGWLRAAGGKDKLKLISFLDKYATLLPRTMLRYAIERLDKKQREYFMNKKL